jgi:hypothetical protein
VQRHKHLDQHNPSSASACINLRYEKCLEFLGDTRYQRCPSMMWAYFLGVNFTAYARDK